MTSSSGTPLYLQVEDAISQFITSLTKLQDQQAQTESMLLKGTEALGNMVSQVALMDTLKDDVARELALIDQYRATISTQYADQHTRTEEALAKLKATIDVRRQEMLGAIREYQQVHQRSVVDFDQRLNRLQLSMNNSTSDIRASITGLATLQNNTITELISKLEMLEASNATQKKHLTWALTTVAAIAVIAVMLAIK